jgi:hypothetical protein
MLGWFRIWQNRTIICTHDTLYFVHGEFMVDSIPLHEILNINEMNEDPEQSRPTPSSSTKSSTNISFARTNSTSESSIGLRNADECEAKKTTLRGHRQSIIQLKTMPEGFNLGRTYYLKPKRDASDQKMIAHLLDARIRAKEIAESKSKIQKSQDVMRTVQESFVFQSVVAVLILLVRILL